MLLDEDGGKVLSSLKAKCFFFSFFLQFLTYYLPFSCLFFSSLLNWSSLFLELLCLLTSLQDSKGKGHVNKQVNHTAEALHKSNVSSDVSGDCHTRSAQPLFPRAGEAGWAEAGQLPTTRASVQMLQTFGESRHEGGQRQTLKRCGLTWAKTAR